jgi:putative ABC transport system ATP-binding protein
VFENVEYPLQMVQNWPKKERQKRVYELLNSVGMADQIDKYPSQISGGQKQRVAVARALVTNAKLVLADEPTANLDSKTSTRIIELMKDMRDKFGTTFIFSTHDPKVMKTAETIFILEDGKLQNQHEGE